MRLYNMYFTCKKYIGIVESMTVDLKRVGSNEIKYIDNWKQKSIVLNELGQMEPLRKRARNLYETIPVIYRDQDRFDISAETVKKFVAQRNLLVVTMQTIIDLYENINPDKKLDCECGFDVKMPQFESIEEFADCMKDLNFIFNNCAYLKSDSADIKFGSVDVGSVWIAFLIVGAGAATIVSNLAKIVDMSVKIKSHLSTVKMQEEALRSVELKNEVLTEVLDAFKKTNKVITDKCVKELEGELGELKDGEEEDKVGRCIQKMGHWLDKGMQIYSSIDAPQEIKDVFPEQPEVNFLSDDIVKLLEEKNK